MLLRTQGAYFQVFLCMDIEFSAKDRDTGSTVADSEEGSPTRKNSDEALEKRGSSPVLRKSSSFIRPDGSSKRIQ